MAERGDAEARRGKDDDDDDDEDADWKERRMRFLGSKIFWRALSRVDMTLCLKVGGLAANSIW